MLVTLIKTSLIFSSSGAVKKISWKSGNEVNERKQRNDRKTLKKLIENVFKVNSG